VTDGDRAAADVRLAEKSASTSRAHASGTDANASLTSKRSISPRCRPDFFNTFFVAGMGPVSMIVGSVPATAVATMRARGVSRCAFTAASLARRMAAAPSLICEEFPAWIHAVGLNAGWSVASFSTVVPGRIPSSTSNTFFVPSAATTSIGVISRLKSPAAWAFAAFICES